MGLIDVLNAHPKISIFGRIEGLESESEDEDILEGEFDPIDAPVLRESEISSLFIVRAKHVLPDGTVHDCFMDVMLPERVCECVYFPQGNCIETRALQELEGEVVCAVPIDSFGDYELFYSRIAPEIGIEVLRQGLAVAGNKGNIASDLGYIFRDEGRFAEAAEAFEIAASETTDSWIFAELAACYRQLGDEVNAAKYDGLCQ